MTKKDFQLIADTIGDLPLSREDRLLTGGFFSGKLYAANPKFDIKKFHQAVIDRIENNKYDI